MTKIASIRIRYIAAGIACLFCLSDAQLQAATVDLTVVSTVTPVACTPILSGGGVADYGAMPAGILKSGGITALPTRSLSLSIGCDASAKISLKVIDNRGGSIVAGIVAAGSGDGNLNDAFNYGLGVASGKKIGGYTITLRPGSYTGDYAAVQLFASSDNGATWQTTSSGVVAKGRSFSWGAAGAGTIGAYQNIVGTITVQPYIDRPENLALSQEVVLDGSATLELSYL
ncbi:DUF1120 domain-containing protein [Herbaspirillum rhizosphaerae]|uniref:DUF1120 domain-containing protein n=1 Tax=Herbaspirillum rhizosphaerae TaxID=346179 RepID=UPI00067BF57F|nr:DUF1120 domain-containing protein [Herbaspirillum rhizosphaerae]